MDFKDLIHVFKVDDMVVYNDYHVSVFKILYNINKVFEVNDKVEVLIDSDGMVQMNSIDLCIYIDFYNNILYSFILINENHMDN